MPGQHTATCVGRPCPGSHHMGCPVKVSVPSSPAWRGTALFYFWFCPYTRILPSFIELMCLQWADTRFWGIWENICKKTLVHENNCICKNILVKCLEECLGARRLLFLSFALAEMPGCAQLVLLTWMRWHLLCVKGWRSVSRVKFNKVITKLCISNWQKWQGKN